ncbi:MAG: cytochrome c maturation protein CcmE [Deltaproteobacteria bacterium]|nr:cytochrome c maturation protein CcmE [Deltaproteobacteria bacterium]
MRKQRKLKPVIICIAGVLVIGYLVYAGIRDTMTYYLTVSEVLAKAPDFQDEPVRVGGSVSPASVKWDPRALKLLFKIEDDRSTIFVDYTGVVPDSFKPGSEVVLEGTYSQEKEIFQATSIMPKCASKYE